MVMTNQTRPAATMSADVVVSGGTECERTAALIAELLGRLAEDDSGRDDRPAWFVASDSARVGELVRRIRSATSAAGIDPDRVRVVTAETIARHLVVHEGDLVAAVPERIIGSELARRTLVVQAIAATEFGSPWRLSADDVLESATRVLDGLAEAGIPVAEAERWQVGDLRRLDRRTDDEDAMAPQSSLYTLREVARRRIDLLAIAATYERLKRERAFLDRTDVFRRATWLAERGSSRPERASWSMLAIDGLDRTTAEERRFLTALDRGGAAIVARAVECSEHHDWPFEASVVELGETTLPADAVERALIEARAGADTTPPSSGTWPGVRAEVFATETAEDAWVVESVRKALEGGVDPGKIAVVVISPERLPSIERRMLDRSIPCRRVGQPLRTGTTATGDLLAVADLLVDPNDVVATTRLARSPRYLRSRISAHNAASPDGAAALAADVARWLRTAADRGPQHALVNAVGDLGIERVLAISHERWVAGESRAVRAELDFLDDPTHSRVTRSTATFRIAFRSIVGPNGATHSELLDDRAEGCVTLVAAGSESGALGSWDHVYLVGLSDEALDHHHRIEDETLDPASLPLAMVGDPLEVPLGAGGRTVEVLGRRMRRRRDERSDAWLVELARTARQSLSLSAAVAPRRSADVHDTSATESRTLLVLKAAGLAVRRPREDSEPDRSHAAPAGHSRQLSPPQGTSLLLVEGGIAEAISSHPEASRIRQEVGELVAYLKPGAEEGFRGFAPRELSARELFLAEADPDRYVQEVMLDLPEPPSVSSERTARFRAWLELDASDRTDRDGHGVLVADGSPPGDPIEQMGLLRGIRDRDLDLPGVGSDEAIADLVRGYRSTPYSSMILNDGGRSLAVVSQGRLVRSRLFGVIDQPDGIWQVIDVRVGPATALDWYRLGVQALALSSPSRSLGCCRLVVVALGDHAEIEVRPSPPADHLTRRLALQWQIVDLVGS